jgi:hypothetical protein
LFVWVINQAHSKLAEKVKFSCLYPVDSNVERDADCARVAQMFQKSRRFLKILDAIRTTRNKCHTEDSQILGVTVQILVAMATWRQGFVHPWSMLQDLSWIFSVYRGKPEIVI